MNPAESTTSSRSGWFLYGPLVRVILASIAAVIVHAVFIRAASPRSESNSDSAVLSTNANSGLPSIGESYCIEVTGRDNRWHVRYPGMESQDCDGLVVQDIHVPCATKIVLVLKSRDYVYTLSVPHFGKKEIAVPELTFQMELEPSDPGRFALDGDQWCGDPHPELQGELVVETPRQFLDWLKGACSGPAG